MHCIEEAVHALGINAQGKDLPVYQSIQHGTVGIHITGSV